MYIYPLSGIHNTSLTNTYFGLNKRECECKCLEYLFILVKLRRHEGISETPLPLRGSSVSGMYV
jgi:hypothetical protein